MLEEGVTFVLKEGFFRIACYAISHFEANFVCLLGFGDVVVFDGGRHVGTRVPPRQKAVGPNGQCKERDIFIDIVHGGIVVRP